MGFEAGAASGSSGMYRTYPGHKFTNEASYNPKCVVAGSRHALVCYPHPYFVVCACVRARVRLFQGATLVCAGSRVAVAREHRAVPGRVRPGVDDYHGTACTALAVLCVAASRRAHMDCAVAAWALVVNRHLRSWTRATTLWVLRVPI